MAHRNLAIISGERANHGGRGIALDNHAVGFCGIEHAANRLQQARCERIKRLPGLHEVEVIIRNDAADREHLIQHLPVLRAHQYFRVHIGVARQCIDHRK